MKPARTLTHKIPGPAPIPHSNSPEALLLAGTPTFAITLEELAAENSEGPATSSSSDPFRTSRFWMETEKGGWRPERIHRFSRFKTRPRGPKNQYQSPRRCCC